MLTQSALPVDNKDEVAALAIPVLKLKKYIWLQVSHNYYQHNN